MGLKLSEAKADPSRVRLSVEDHIGLIEMVDAEGRNGFSEGLVRALLWALAEVEANREIVVAVLAGLPEIFSSGATPGVLEAIREGNYPATELVLGRHLIDLRVPVIAAAEGHAIGGGFALLLSCDLSVLAKESRYGANFMSLGITPGMGTTRLLEEIVGKSLAHELLYTGELRRGSTLVGAGFSAVVERAEVRDRAHRLAWSIAEKPRSSVELLKRTLSLPRRRAFEEARTLESLMHERSFRDLDLEALGQGVSK
ncbi:MAG: polyketide synthase [Myxococcota bacterium]